MEEGRRRLLRRLSGDRGFEVVGCGGTCSCAPRLGDSRSSGLLRLGTRPFETRSGSVVVRRLVPMLLSRDRRGNVGIEGESARGWNGRALACRLSC